ncbi:MAG: phosphatase PAP2 family protein [Desulfitobacteriaceae bacterium]|nr:phosphatase PAP2 family protein [Desulfitobacteriaceae bacterium]MDI6879754.1 phosphatase PAP2 family protein [Desulfitobacteriaceae bacterium]MDI6913306.1 phosphatase PAP2 family protein [Desulfitobacteriaceae bacterium]
MQKIFNKHYPTGIGILFSLLALTTAIQPGVGLAYKALLFVMALAAFTAYSELRREVRWLPFLILVVPIYLAIQYLSVHGYDLWGKMLSWQMRQDVVVDLNPIFRDIPFNDAAFARRFQSEPFTRFMQLVYANGFVVPALVPIYRAMIARDLHKVLKYLLSAHIFQVFLITPFYLTFHLQEVWYVLGHADGMARNLTEIQAAGVTLNSFPSMHTSIAFAMFLVLLEEKNRLFKWVWGFFCLSVIFSTMYLEIHWVLDVIGGLIFAYATVKLVDFILNRVEGWIPTLLKSLYFAGRPIPPAPANPSVKKYPVAGFIARNDEGL